MSKQSLAAKKDEDLSLDSIGIKIGDICISHNETICRVSGFEDGKIQFESKWNDEWHHYGSCDAEEFHGKYIIFEKSYDEHMKDAIEALHDPDALMLDDSAISETDALALYDKSMLMSAKSTLEARKNKVELFSRLIHKKLDHLRSVKSELSKQLSKVYKVIGILELYLGIKEDIIQIKEGKLGNIGDPITFRQMILYMDEEVGDPSDGGLDFERIDQFDDWVSEKNNYQKLAPEDKCVVVLKPRRYDKEYYGYSVFERAFYNAYNKMTYILIRNGENLYRVFSENLGIGDDFFPSKEKMDHLMDVAEKGEQLDRDGEGAKDTILDYKKNLLLMQGLVDRTDLFHPLPDNFSFMNQDMYDKYLNFIYDDSPSLTEGHETYEKWHTRINSSIKRGTRILFTGFPIDIRTDKYQDNRLQHYMNIWPGIDVYSVKYIEKVKKYYSEGYTDKLVCHYNPEDDIWGGYYEGSHKREKSVAFYLYKSDDFVLNYDLMDIQSVDRFLNDRYDRRNYLKMMPILYWVKKKRLGEIEKEKGLVKLISDRLGVKENLVWREIDWWKKKNIWKRPIMENDEKALRMIENRIKKKNG